MNIPQGGGVSTDSSDFDSNMNKISPHQKNVTGKNTQTAIATQSMIPCDLRPLTNW